MPQTQLFPPEVIENLTETYLPKVSVRGQLIYTLLLLALATVLGALPFVRVDVSVQSMGMVRSLAEKTEIKAFVAGTIKHIGIAENQLVSKGQTLFTIATQELDNKLQNLNFQHQDKRIYLQDLQVLTQVQRSNVFGQHPTLSPLYTEQLGTFRALIQENLFKQKAVQKELEADRYLLKEKAISRREFDTRKYEFDKLVAEYETLFSRQLSQWKAELHQYQIDLVQIRAESQQIHQQKSYYVVKAPVTGNVQQMLGKYEGSYVQVGEVLGVISPDSSLLIECMVSPQDIGLLRKGMAAVFQIDAFNYNEWGVVKGEVAEVAPDFSMIQNQPIFKVRCKAYKLNLSLKNGYTATLKKGMTLRANFVVTQRSLFQLLYDKADNWLNPKAIKP